MIASPLLAWYERHKRPLPWRLRPDPYRVWLSEVMLQQTRIEVVRGYYERFLRRFPTVRDLAAAPLDDVLHAWAGLGYYSRARNLHRAAQHVASVHGGRFPRTAAELAALPGIGRYTAGAIASIAFGERAPVVDGNVARVLARLACLEGDVRTPPVSRRLWALAGEWIDAARPGDFNQALMELGETICTPRGPRCDRCPLRAHCAALRQGRVDELPTPRRVGERPEVAVVCGVIQRRGRVLLARRAPAGLFGGLWELPGAEATTGRAGPRALARAIATRVGLAVEVGDRLGVVRHVLTHRVLTLTVYACRAARGRTRAADGYDALSWVPLAETSERVALSTLARRALALAARGTVPRRGPNRTSVARLATARAV